MTSRTEMVGAVPRFRGVGSVAVALTILGAGCDLSVTNPGPVQDKFLDNSAAHQALVNGAGRALGAALNYVAYTGAAVTREIHPAGSTAAFGITPLQQRGLLDPLETNSHWSLAHRARWTAEDAVRRLERVTGDISSSALAAQGLIWVGYANRLLGENMCEAVIDGGQAEPYTVYLQRAEAAFTTALEIAGKIGSTDLQNAARAGRASVRADLGQWSGAVADATSVPKGFVYRMPYYTLPEDDTRNRIYYATNNHPYRAHTTWHTPFEDYYRNTHDPRTPWGTDARYPYGDAAVQGIGQVPWYFELKYTKDDSPINLSSEREMRLIVAEARLHEGNWQAAVTLMTQLRAELGLGPLGPAGSSAEAWTLLKRERGIELWLEGRRLGDLRRWDAEKAPGQLDPLEAGVPPLTLDPSRTLCFPISQAELDANTNLTRR